MKTSEFIKKVDELGYYFAANDDGVIVYDDNRLIIAKVYENSINKLDTFWNGNISNDLFDLCIEYAKTPIGNRKEDKKYYLYNPIKEKYFNYLVDGGTYYWFDSTQLDSIQTQFTKEEIKDHKFRDIMELLVKEEVKE